MTPRLTLDMENSTIEGAAGAGFEVGEGDDDVDVGSAAPGGDGVVGVVEVVAGHRHQSVGPVLDRLASLHPTRTHHREVA